MHALFPYTRSCIADEASIPGPLYEIKIYVYRLDEVISSPVNIRSLLRKKKTCVCQNLIACALLIISFSGMCLHK